MEYWHDIQTEKSWEVLQKLKGAFPFVLIGGWAVYLWTKSHKSKDIDIIVDFPTLAKLKKKYDLRKNDRLKRYEIKEDGIDIDVYVKHYSQLALPLKTVETTKIEGFDVAKPEFLLALKQQAEFVRQHSVKGEKDRIDIMMLLLKSGIDFREYWKLMKENKKEELLGRLAAIVRDFNDGSYLGMNPRQLKLEKKEILKNIKEAMIQKGAGRKRAGENRGRKKKA